MKTQQNQHLTSITSRFNRLTPIAWACGSLLLGMYGGQVHAALASQTITFTTVPSTLTVGMAGPISAEGHGSSEFIEFTSTTPSICTVWVYSQGGYGSGMNYYLSSQGDVTAIADGICTVIASKTGDSNYAAAQVTQNITVGATPTPVPTPAPTPPITPKAVNDGIVGNTVGSGAEVLQVCQTTLYAGASGATVRANGTNGVIDVAIQNGSLNIPCPAANPFCTTAQNQVTALTDETVRFGNNCEVSQIQVTPPTPTTSPTRLNGQSLIDSVMAVVLANAPSIGVETVRKANQWNALQLGFSTGTASVQAQSPMLVNPTLPDSVTVLPNGTVRVVTKGVIVNFAPALLDTSRFTDVLQAGLPTAQMRMNADGTLVITHDRVFYALRPNIQTTTTNTSSFTVDSSGNLRFDNQGLAPAVYNFDQFAAIIKEALPTATVQTQLNGTGITVTVNGTTYTLKPDYRVQPNLGFSTSNIEVRNGKVFVNYPFGFTQGFAVQ